MDDSALVKLKQLIQGTVCLWCEQPITGAWWRLVIDRVSPEASDIELAESVFCSRECLNALFDSPDLE